MKAVIQRVSQASVSIDQKIEGKIKIGLLILLGIGLEDTIEDITWVVKKSLQMRIFGDVEDKMNLSVQDMNGDILLISQFTLMANTKKGNRPSYITAARPEIAIPLYEKAIMRFEEVLGKKIETGIFGANMKVDLINDGPVTIILDSKNKE